MRDNRMFVAAGATTVACCSLLALSFDLASDETLWPSIGICSGILALALVFAIRKLGFGWSSAPLVYLLYLWLFHFPLALFTSLDGDMLRSLPIFIQARLFDPSWCRAEMIALICAAAFTVGAALTSGRRTDALRSEGWSQDGPLAAIGTIELLLGVAIIVFSIMRGGGRQVFLTPYIDLYDTVFSGPFGYGVLLLTLGVPIALGSVKKRAIWALLGVQTLFTCIMLLLGARSAALFGPLIVVMVLSKRGIIIPRWITVVSIVTVLWVIAIVGVARQGAVGDNITAATAANPFDALLEMGGSLYTVRLFDGWILDGDSFQLGGGYWLPFERAIGLVIPGIRRDLPTDSRSAREVLSYRTSGLGGSVVAEAYYNFGLFAPLAFFVPLGWLLGRLDRAAHGPLSTAWLVVVLYPLLMEVRGWFISVPAMVALGAIPLLLRSFSLWRHRLRNNAPVTESATGKSYPQSAVTSVTSDRKNCESC